MASHTMSWLGNMFFLVHTILVSHQNLPLFFSFPTLRHKRLMAPKESIIRQVIQTNGLAYGSCPITKAKGVQTVVPQSFRPFNTEEERTLLVKGGEITTPQVIRASNFRVPRIHIHKENTQFSIDQLMEC